MDEVTSDAVRANAGCVIGPTQLRLVLGMPGSTPDLMLAVSKLALGSVFAESGFLELATEFGFITIHVHHFHADLQSVFRQADTSAQFSVLQRGALLWALFIFQFLDQSSDPERVYAVDGCRSFVIFTSNNGDTFRRRWRPLCLERGSKSRNGLASQKFLYHFLKIQQQKT